MAPEPLTILCFGDSLTAGYSMYGMKMTPYATTTSAFLSEQLSLNADEEVQITVEGVSGQLVTSGFMGRMERLYSKTTTATQQPFKWLVFLGGTNDLAYNRSITDIYATIVAITDIPRAQGAKVLLCTIPECAHKSSALDKKRNDLNDLIREDEREGVYILDLNKRMPYHTMGAIEREEMWDDGLHFTEEGYERIGALVGRRLLGIIERGEGKEDE